MRFERLTTDYDVEVVHVPFELRPDVPEGGISARAHGLEHTERVEAHLVRLAEDEGVPYVNTDLIPNTHRAMVMAELARDQGVYDSVHAAIFGAYFGEGRDIGEESVLLDVGTAAGLAAEDIVEAWATGRFEERLHGFYHLGVDLGIDTTPSALICNELIVGSRPYGVIRDAVERCLITPDNIEQRASESDEQPGSSEVPDSGS